MDTRTYILLHRIPECIPGIKISNLKEKCYTAWTGAISKYLGSTDFFGAFLDDFGVFDSNDSLIATYYNKIFLSVDKNMSISWLLFDEIITF